MKIVEKSGTGIRAAVAIARFPFMAMGALIAGWLKSIDQIIKDFKRCP